MQSLTWKFHCPANAIIDCNCVGVFRSIGTIRLANSSTVLSSTDFEKSNEMGASVRPKRTTTLPRTGTGEVPNRPVPTRKVIGGSPSATHLEGHRSTSFQKPKLVQRAFRCWESVKPESRDQWLMIFLSPLGASSSIQSGQTQKPPIASPTRLN